VSEEDGHQDPPEGEDPEESPPQAEEAPAEAPAQAHEEADSPVSPPPAEPGPAIEDAKCSTHEHIAAVGTCEHCGSFSCADCLGELGGRMICRACVVEGRVEVGLSPWDERATRGMFAAWWETLKQVTLKPGEFFSNLAPSHFMGAAIGFAILAGTPGQIAAVITSNLGNALLFDALGLDLNSAYGNDPISEMFRPGGPANIVIGVVMAPIGVLMNAMIYGLLGHLGLMIVGGANKKMEASLKVACYAAAINFWMIIPLPYLIQMVVGIWWMVVLAIGLMKMHNTSGVKAAFAVLWFPCLCGCLIGGVAGIAGLAATTL
jgi:hypothetical protein